MPRRLPVRPIVVLAAAAVLVAVSTSTPAVAASAPTAVAAATAATVPVVVPSPIGTYTFTGHGWGHGRGMGQYGALGYALAGWSYAQILDHYYGGTVPAAPDDRNLPIDVELTDRTGKDTAATGTSLTLDAGAGAQPVFMSDGTTPAHAVRLVPDGKGTFTAQAARTECGSGSIWADIGPYPSGTVIRDGAGQSITQCDDTREESYRGSLVAWQRGTTSYTFNRVAVEDYLRDVVPHESPASWGTLGDGAGMQALEAQAVAARSYALSSSRPSGAKTCDTTACQVYLPYATRPYATSTWTTLPYPQSDQAVAATAGQVRRMGSAGGAIARTEFSSSTGGFTAGGTFPAVVDDGDAVAQNPNHTWTATFSAVQAAAELGLSGVSGITITGRNGLGDFGGRVTQLQVTDAAGAPHSYTGAQFQSLMGLKSDWFTVAGITPGQAQAVVRSLYHDVLGRDPDPTGMAGWTATVQQTGNGQWVANGIVYSKERLVTLVSAQYRAALGREPETGGLNNWVGYLESGAGVSDLQIGIYASQESLNVLGGGDTATWVGAMYASILGRQAAPSELAQWTQVALTQGRVRTVAGIAKSAEAGLHRLDGYYQQYLGRSLDPTGARTWLPYMTGAGDFQVPGFIGGSIEYWNRSQTRYPS